MTGFYIDRSTKDEARIINALIVEAHSRKPIFERLTPDHFADIEGKKMFEALLACWRRNISLDAVGTIQAICPSGNDRIDYFLQQGTPGIYNADWKDCIEVLDRLELTRKILAKANEAIEASQAGDKTRSDLLSSVKDLWTPVIESPVCADTRDLSEIIITEAHLFEEARSGMRKPMPWGIAELDFRAPVYPGQMVIVAARPGMGKTALMISSALHQLRAGFKVGIVSVEMDSEDLLRRFYVQIAELPYDFIQRGMKGATKEELTRYLDAREYMLRFSDMLFLHGGEKVSVERIQSIGYDWVKAKGVEALWLDYLTDFRLPKAKEHHLAVEAASQAIRDLSRKNRLNIPIYLLAQLNRSGADSYPKMAHLKASSGLEQDAHVIILIDRPEQDRTGSSTPGRVYVDQNGSTRDMEGKAALIIAKNRNGRGGFVFADYHGDRMLFENERRYRDEVMQ